MEATTTRAHMLIRYFCVEASAARSSESGRSSPSSWPSLPPPPPPPFLRPRPLPPFPPLTCRDCRVFFFASSSVTVSIVPTFTSIKRFSILDLRFWILDSRRNPKSKIPNPRSFTIHDHQEKYQWQIHHRG